MLHPQRCLHPSPGAVRRGGTLAMATASSSPGGGVSSSSPSLRSASWSATMPRPMPRIKSCTWPAAVTRRRAAPGRVQCACVSSVCVPTRPCRLPRTGVVLGAADEELLLGLLWVDLQAPERQVGALERHGLAAADVLRASDAAATRWWPVHLTAALHAPRCCPIHTAHLGQRVAERMGWICGDHQHAVPSGRELDGQAGGQARLADAALARDHDVLARRARSELLEASGGRVHAHGAHDGSAGATRRCCSYARARPPAPEWPSRGAPLRRRRCRADGGLSHCC